MRDPAKDPDLASDPTAQAVLVRGLWRRGDRETLRNLVWRGQVEAMLRECRGGSANIWSAALHIGCSAAPVLSLACGALEIECSWSSQERGVYACDAALHVVHLIADPLLRAAWLGHLEWWRGGKPWSGRVDAPCVDPCDMAAEAVDPYALSSASEHAHAACVYAVTRTPRYAVGLASRAALEAVGLAYGSDARARERSLQTRALLSALLGVACD